MSSKDVWQMQIEESEASKRGFEQALTDPKYNYGPYGLAVALAFLASAFFGAIAFVTILAIGSFLSWKFIKYGKDNLRTGVMQCQKEINALKQNIRNEQARK